MKNSRHNQYSLFRIAMESAQRSGMMKAPKVRASNENVSPLQMEMDDQRGRDLLQSMTTSPRFHPFAENIDAGSPLARYFFAGSPISSKVVTGGEAFTSPTFGSSKYRSAKSQQQCGGSSSGSSSRSSFGPLGRLLLSPLSSVENLEMAPHMSPPMYRTPVKVEEEVLVMDDILVRSGGKKGRSSSSSTSSGLGSSLSSSSSSSSPWVKDVLKTEVCRAWDESGGNCRKNSKTQFAHGKEEIHPTRLSMKSRSQAQTGKSPLSAGSSVYGSNSRRTVYQHHAAAEYRATRSQPVTPVKLEPRRTLAPANPNTSSNWSPLDDGIEVVLPNGSDKAPSREEVDSHISSVLHGRTAKRRLLVFVKLCEGHDPVIDKKPPH